MESTLIPFGLLDGVLVRAVDVANGLACGCHCPGCQTPLVAANRGTKNTPHFRHSSAVDCRAGYESSLHKVAKALLVDRMYIMTPVFEQIISHRTDCGREVCKAVRFKGGVLRADHAEAEVVLGGVTPDVIFEVSGHQLLIEIRVTHKVDGAKHNRLRALGLSTLEIDLSSMDMRTICDPELFEQALLHDPINKHWVHSNRGVRMVSEAMHQLTAEISAMNKAHLLETEIAESSRQSRQELARLEAQAIRTIRSEEVARESGSPEMKAMRMDKRELRQKILERAEAIAASVQRSVREWGGQAMQCQTCFMANPPDSTNCRHCGAARGLDSITFSHDYANTVLSRLKCSPRVDQSFERAPALMPWDEQAEELDSTGH